MTAPGPGPAPDLAALRETVALAIAQFWGPLDTPEETADAVLAALAPHVTTQVEQRDAEEPTRLRRMQVAALRYKAERDTALVEQRDADRQDELNAAYDQGAEEWMAQLRYVGEQLAEVKAERNAALARVDAARRDALTPVLALLAEWDTTTYKLPPGYPMTVNEFCRIWFKAPLRAAVESPDQPEGPPPLEVDEAVRGTFSTGNRLWGEDQR